MSLNDSSTPNNLMESAARARVRRKEMELSLDSQLSRAERLIDRRAQIIINRYEERLKEESVSSDDSVSIRGSRNEDEKRLENESISSEEGVSTRGPRKLLLVIASVCLLNTICLISFSALLMGFLFFCLAMIFSNLSCDEPKKYFRKLAAILCLATIAVATPTTMNDLTNGLRHVGDQALKRGAESLSYPTRFGLWWSTVWLSLGAVVYGAPYASAENILMLLPGKNERVWKSDFPTKAIVVRKLVANAKKVAGKMDRTFQHDLSWKSYCADNCDVALSLNGGKLEIYLSDLRKKCTARARVKVHYDPKFRSSTLVEFGKYALRIDQAAYWALQELGWLNPYDLTYHWKC